MTKIIKVDGVWLPKPAKDLEYSAEKVKNSKQTEAGTTMVSVVRNAKLSITGSWILTGSWMEKFRAMRNKDTVTVEVYYPKAGELSAYECEFEIEKEKHITDARNQLDIMGIYEVSVNITEL